MAIRNLYIEERDLGVKDSSARAGSRMYRGDDIYLLNWWPLDNQNTIGGGVGAQLPTDRTTRDDHRRSSTSGMQRLDNPYQYQQIPVVAPFGFGTVDVDASSIARASIETLKLTTVLPQRRRPRRASRRSCTASSISSPPGTSRSAHESTGAPRRQRACSLGVAARATSPASATRTRRSSCATRAGIAAYDPLAVPITFALDQDDRAARSETLIAPRRQLGDGRRSASSAGGVRSLLPRRRARRATSTQKYDEGERRRPPERLLRRALRRRGRGRATSSGGIATPPTRRRQRAARPRRAIWRFGVIPYFSPAGRGSTSARRSASSTRSTLPQLRARALSIPRRTSSRSATIEHFLGIGAEWWFNSSARIREEEPRMKTFASSAARPRALCARGLGALPERMRLGRRAHGSPTLATHVGDWRDEVIYQVLVDRFANGDVEQRLPASARRARRATRAATGRASTITSTTSRSSASRRSGSRRS